MNLDFIRRTWAEIDLDAVAYNFREIQKRLNPGTKLCCVVKADAYGHGSVTVAKEYEAMGADWLAVSNLEEAEELRGAGIRLPVLILGYTPPELAMRLCSGNFSQAILSLDYALRLSDVAQRGGYTVKGHIAVDTGMSRIGFLYQDKDRDRASIDEMQRASQLPGIIPEGIFTHFSVAGRGRRLLHRASVPDLHPRRFPFGAAPRDLPSAPLRQLGGLARLSRVPAGYGASGYHPVRPSALL